MRFMIIFDQRFNIFFVEIWIRVNNHGAKFEEAKSVHSANKSGRFGYTILCQHVLG